MRLMVPSFTKSTMEGSLMFTTALGAKRRPLMPSARMAVSTWPMTLSPSRKLWWKEMVMPSFSPEAMMASFRVGTSLFPPGTRCPAVRRVTTGLTSGRG